MTPCPSHEQLQGLLCNELTEEIEQSAIEHIEDCPHCQQRLETLTAEQLGPGAFPSTPEPDDNAVSEVEFPGYEILDELGRGGMGVVYLARQVVLNRLVALKIVKKELLNHPDAVVRFHSEAAIVASFRHRYIVQIYEVRQHGQQPFLALEYVNGGSLDARLDGSAFPPKLIAAFVQKLAEGIEHAHRYNIVHRDLKPANILLDDAAADSLGTPKITDFGLAKHLQSELRLTKTDTILGTPNYMAPEQFDSQRGAISPATDIYALGVILYELLTGRLPIQAPTHAEMMVRVLDQEPLPLRRLVPTLPRDLETICLKCLRKEPHTRYSSAHALSDDLQRYLDGRPITARPVGVGEHLVRWTLRHKALAAVLVLAPLVMVAMIIVPIIAHLNDQLQTRNTNLESAREELQSSNTSLNQTKIQLEQRVSEVDRLRYFGLVNAAQGEWRDNEIQRARDQLARCDPKHRNWEWHHVNRLCHAEQLHLPVPEGFVQAVAYSPDGKYLAASGWFEDVLVWDAATGKIVHRFAANQTLALAFSPDSRLLCAGDIVFDLETGEIKTRIKLPINTIVHGVCFRPDGRQLALAPTVGLFIWDMAQEKIVAKAFDQPPHTAFFCVAYSPDGDTLALSDPSGIRLLDAETVESIALLKPAHPGLFKSVAFSPDGKRLAARSNHISVWDVASRTEIHTHWNDTEGECLGHAYSPDGRWLALGWQDRRISILEAETGRHFATLRGHLHQVNAVAFGPDSRHLFSGSTDKSAKLWDIRGAGESMLVDRIVEITPPADAGQILDLAFHREGRLLAIAERRGVDRRFRAVVGGVGLFDVKTGERTATIDAHPGQLTQCVAFHPSQDILVTGGSDRTVRVWNLSEDHPPTILRCRSSVTDLEVSPDGKRFASVDNGSVPGQHTVSSEVRLWDFANLNEFHALTQQAGRVKAIAFSPDGTLLATAQDDATVKLWNTATRNQTRTLTGLTDSVHCLAFDSTGEQLIAADSRGHIRRWRLETGEITFEHSLEGNMSIQALALTPDDTRLICGGTDKNLCLLDLESKTIVLVLRGHHRSIRTLAFSPDGHLLASGGGSRDGELRLWDATPLRSGQ